MSAAESFDYCILGGGAVGSVFAGRLAKAGYSVQLLTRSSAHPEAIQKNGLMLDIDHVRHCIKFHATTVDLVQPAKVVMVFTKAYQTATALESVLEKIGSATFVSLQNGLGNGDVLADFVPPQRIVHGVTMVPADAVEPGVVSTTSTTNSWLGPYHPDASSQVKKISEDLVYAGFEVSLEDDIEIRIWQKACFNVAMNGLCGLTHGSPGLLETHPDGKHLAHELANEGISIARAEGVAVDEEAIHNLINFACATHTYHKPSMLQDLEAGRQTEIESLNGYIHECGKRHGIKTPLSDMILRLVRLLQDSPNFWSKQPR
jgi:2-dehydropantoate 2-reductase